MVSKITQQKLFVLFVLKNSKNEIHQEILKKLSRIVRYDRLESKTHQLILSV